MESRDRAFLVLEVGAGFDVEERASSELQSALERDGLAFR
jgi:hypothetical protein